MATELPVAISVMCPMQLDCLSTYLVRYVATYLNAKCAVPASST